MPLTWMAQTYFIAHYSTLVAQIQKEGQSQVCVTRKALATVKQLRGNRLGRALLSFLADVATPRLCAYAFMLFDF